MTFEYDNRGRLIGEERVVDSTATTYDLAYTYDQLGNRETKYDAVTELRTEYTYDVELDPNDPNMPYATHNNRLLYYELYDEGQTPRKLLRTVSYTYYDDGDVSNITIKDEDPNGTADPAYDRYQDLALYYNADKSLRIALRDSWELNQYGRPTDYDPNYAHEFRYDAPQARYLAAFYDELYDGQDPNRWPLDQTVDWSEHVGETIYNDGQLTRQEDPNDPGAFLFDFTEQLHHTGPGAQESVATGDLRYNHGDLIDSTMLTTEDYGAPASAVRYTAFGEILDANGSPGGDPPTGFTRYQYAGGWSYESGLLKLYGANPNLPPITLKHVGHRWYQADIGRFVQRDPIGIMGGLNVYAYCENDPLTVVDPEGLEPSLGPAWPPGHGRWTGGYQLPPWIKRLFGSAGCKIVSARKPKQVVLLGDSTTTVWWSKWGAKTLGAKSVTFIGLRWVSKYVLPPLGIALDIATLIECAEYIVPYLEDEDGSNPGKWRQY